MKTVRGYLRRMLRVMVAAIVAVSAFLVYAMRAEASPSIQYGVQDDAWLLGGPGTFDERLDRVDALGVDLVRVNVRWDQVAAKRPAQATRTSTPRTTGRSPTSCSRVCAHAASAQS